MAFWRFILISALLMLAGISCRSLTAPPGFAGSGSGTAGRIEFPSGISMEAQYALLAWYEEQYGQEARRQTPATYGVAVNARNDRAVRLRQEAARTLVGRYPDFVYVPPQGGLGFLFETLGSREDFAEMQMMLDGCQRILSTRRIVEVPVQECLEYLKNSPNGHEAVFFQMWSVSHAQLELSVQDEENITFLKKAAEALKQKQLILERLAESAGDLGSGEGVKALDLLESTEKTLPPHVDFGLIGDDLTLAKLRKARLMAPECAVKAVLNRAEDLASLEDAEGILTNALAVWESDERFLQAVYQENERIRQVVEALFQKRIAALAKEVSSVSRTGDYWHWMTRARKRVAELSLDQHSSNGRFGHGSWGCYVSYGLSQKLSEELLAFCERLSGEAEAFYLEKQRQAAEIANQPGVVMALGKILSDICGSEPELSQRRVSAARQQLQAKPALFSLFLEDFVALEEGQGRIWTRDLFFVLQQRLTEWQGDGLLKLVNEIDKANCVLASGELLEFSGGEVEKQEVPTWHRWYGEAFLDKNDTMQFIQPEWEEEIVVQTSLRTGHVRLRAAIHAAEGAEREKGGKFFEQNVFYPREFVQESASQPKRIGEFRCDDQRKLKPVEGAAELRRERVWSAGEMMDFTRQAALQECAGWVFATLLKWAADTEENGLEFEDGVAEFQAELLFGLEKVSIPAKDPLEEVVAELRQTLPERIREAILKDLRKE